MVLRARLLDTPYTMSLRPEGLTLGVGDAIVAAWDSGSRLYTLTDGDRTWRRGLSGAMLDRGAAGTRRVRTKVTGPDADAVVDRAAALARDTALAMTGTAWAWESAPDAASKSEVSARLAGAAAFDARAARIDAAAFARVYEPVGILPPDQYLALVVQATRGCAFNTCTFCELHQDGYAVKTPDGFADHVDAVVAYLGASAGLRSRGVFLGSANALAVPMARLEPLFEILASRLDSAQRGVSAFVDGFTGQFKTAGDFEVLGRYGLRRVYVGLESGHDPLLRAVHKPASARQAVDTVLAVKAAGLRAGVIVMTGLGGERYARAHETDTAEALSAMALGPGDLLYFSELVVPTGRPYAADACDAGYGSLDSGACRRQRDTMLHATRFCGGRPTVGTYDVREFVY